MAYELSPEEQGLEKDLYSAMADRAKSHLAPFGGQLVILDYNPQLYRAQRLHNFCVEPKGLAPPDSVDDIGRLMMANYDDVAADLRDPRTEQGAWLRESGERMRAGESAIIATDHKTLIGLGEVLGTLASALRHENFEFETAISLFRMLSVLGWKFKQDMPVAPCVDVVSSFSHHTLQVFTRTRKTRESDLMERNAAMPAYTKANNQRVKEKTNALLAQGGVMLAQAPNASVWTWNPAGTQCVAERITAGTAEAMAHPKAHIVEVTFDVIEKDGHREAHLEICRPPYKLSDPEEVHIVGEHLVERSNDHSEARGEGRPYVYETARQAASTEGTDF
jgi:hypothetical protein